MKTSSMFCLTLKSKRYEIYKYCDEFDYVVEEHQTVLMKRVLCVDTDKPDQGQGSQISLG